MANTLHLRVVTPVDVVYDADVNAVIIPTVSGQITVLPEHTALVSVLTAGELVIQAGGSDTPFAVAGGVLEMSDNTLSILADSAEQPSKIDLDAAKKRAAELVNELDTETAMDIKTYNLLQKELLRERAKIDVASKWRA